MVSRNCILRNALWSNPLDRRKFNVVKREHYEQTIRIWGNEPKIINQRLDSKNANNKFEVKDYLEVNIRTSSISGLTTKKFCHGAQIL